LLHLETKKYKIVKIHQIIYKISLSKRFITMHTKYNKINDPKFT